MIDVSMFHPVALAILNGYLPVQRDVPMELKGGPGVDGTIVRGAPQPTLPPDWSRRAEPPKIGSPFRNRPNSPTYSYRSLKQTLDSSS
jgi:hypothetical protein